MAEFETPVVHLETSIGILPLHYGNTRMRLFRDTGLDHVEYTIEDKIKGIVVARAVMDTLFELEYPMQFDPIPDEDTIEWFMRLVGSEFEDEIREL